MLGIPVAAVCNRPLTEASAVTDRRYGFRILTLLFAMFGVWPSALASSASVSVAAAANLVYALDALNAEFKKTAPDIAVISTTGASGNLFAQIQHGAPFDVFLSADTDYPKQVVAAKLGDAATLRTFATGRLVLWTTRADVDVSDIASAIRSATLKKLAIAQPKLAPYGRAARAALEELGLSAVATPKLVIGESISQTTQFVETGNADAGFIAMSVVVSPKLRGKGRWAEVPAALYANVPLDHAVVLTTRGAANPAARRYLDFLASKPAKKILHDFGYGVP